MHEIPEGGRWFVAAGVAFHATAADVIDFADADDVPGDWITIGGGGGAKGERHAGGFPVKVAGGTPDAEGKLRGGTIVGGRLAARLGLHGKTTDQVADHLATVNEHRKAGKSLTEAVKAAHKDAPAPVASPNQAAGGTHPVPPGRDLGNGLFLYTGGTAGEQYLVHPGRLADAAGMAAKLEAAAQEQGAKRGKKNKEQAANALKTAADIRSQIEQLERGERPASHREAATTQGDQDARAAESARTRAEHVERQRTENRPKYEHLKAFMREHGYFPMPGTIAKRPTKYLGTPEQRLRITGDGAIEVFTSPNMAAHGDDKKWLRLTGDMLAGAMSSTDWQPPAAAPAAAPVPTKEPVPPKHVETPNTERAASWWGTGASRYHWNSGGLDITDGRAAAEMPGRPLVTTVESHADRSPTVEDPGVLVRSSRGGDEADRGARAELYAMARRSGAASDHYSAKPLGYMTSVNDAADGEMHRLCAQVYRKIGAGEDPDAVVADTMKEARESALAYNKNQAQKYPFDDRRAATKGIAGHLMPEAAEDKIRFAGQMARRVLEKYRRPKLPQDPWLTDKGYTPGPAPADASPQGFIAGLKGFEHSGHESGAGWIGRHNGELVSSRSSPGGAVSETFRVRFPDRDLLVTWGRGGGGWQVVPDRVKAGAPAGDQAA